MHFHSKMAWPPATYDIISRNHSNWPSLNLSQNGVRDKRTATENFRCWCFIVEEKNQKNLRPVVVDFRFISAFVMSCEFTRNSVTKFLPAQFPWIWCKCLLTNLIHSKIFNLTKYREVLVKYSPLIAHAGMPIWIWQQLQERLTDSFFKYLIH